MKRMLLIAVLTFMAAGCATTPRGPVIGTTSWYEQRIQEIDSAYQRQEITKEQQLKLKNEADHLRLMYQRDVDRQLRWGGSYMTRPLYDCNSGVCTPVYP